jgi:hypothetical protein
MLVRLVEVIELKQKEFLTPIRRWGFFIFVIQETTISPSFLNVKKINFKKKHYV